jgi:F-type H+-transporting ATPase subunit alpha
VELLKQPQYAPFPIADQVVSIYTGTKGYLDNLPGNQVRAFENGLRKHIHDEHPEIVDEITRTGELSDGLAAKLAKTIEDFKAQFVAKMGGTK